MKKTIIFILLILLSASVVSAVSNTSPLMDSDLITVLNIKNYTIDNLNGSVVGSIKLMDINTNNINSIIVTSDTYYFRMNITHSWFALQNTVSTTFTDYVSGLTNTTVFTVGYSIGSDTLLLPVVLRSTVDPTLTLIDTEDVSFVTYPASIHRLINKNSSSIKLSVYPAQVIVIQVIGDDKVNLEYLAGTKEQIIVSSFVKTDLGLYEISLGVLRAIPLVGPILADSISFIVAFFVLFFSIIGFFVFDFFIIILLMFTFALIHGIITMATGGNPFDGLVTVVTDCITFIKLTLTIFIQAMTLIWNVASALASWISALKPL